MTSDGPGPAALNSEVDVAVRLARAAGDVLRRHLSAGLTVDYKTSADDPVTAADREASSLIVAGLHAAFPGDGLLSEEETDSPERLTRERVWIIDPIDGTREFTQGEPGFAVSIGLCVRGAPVLGVVYAPATDELFTGVVGRGVWKAGVPVQLTVTPPYRISVSSTEHRRELHRSALPGMHPSGSIALKLARIAAGELHATFTMSPRSEWDIAAGHALLRAGGGDLRRRDGRPVTYNRPRPHIEQGLIAGHPDAVAWLDEELRRHDLPNAHLGVTPADPAWALLPETDRAALAGHPAVSLRAAGGRVLALLVVDPRTGDVQRAEGDAFHLERLSRDVTRALGTFAPPAAPA